MCGPVFMESSMLEDDTATLIENCTAFASKHGIDAMLDALAGCYQTYAPFSRDAAIKIVCELADLDGVEYVTIQ